MIYDLQKASILKRISAFLLDFILICILATGFGALLSIIVDFNGCYSQFKDYNEQYEALGIDPITMTEEKHAELTDEARKYYDDTIIDYRRAMSNCISRAFLIISIGLFLSHLVLEFIIPLLLKNGQTVGKKVFSVGVMQVTGVRLKPISLFVRAILGKYAIETMVPLSMLLIFFFITPEAMLFILFIALYIFQIVLFFVSKRYAFIHDALASSVVVDMQTQMIFGTNEEMIRYKEEISKQQAEKAEYK